jgi:hypothetical protein
VNNFENLDHITELGITCFPANCDKIIEYLCKNRNLTKLKIHFKIPGDSIYYKCIDTINTHPSINTVFFDMSGCSENLPKIVFPKINIPNVIFSNSYDMIDMNITFGIRCKTLQIKTGLRPDIESISDDIDISNNYTLTKLFYSKYEEVHTTDPILIRNQRICKILRMLAQNTNPDECWISSEDCLSHNIFHRIACCILRAPDRRRNDQGEALDPYEN